MSGALNIMTLSKKGSNDLYKHLKSAEDFESWGWLLFMHDGKIRIVRPGIPLVGYTRIYNADVILRWTWDYEDMWVFKNRWGGYGVWLSALANHPNGMLGHPEE